MQKQIAFISLILATGNAVSGQAHQHGVAQMMVAVDTNAATIEFVSPLENLVGFEHAPRNDRERRLIQAVKEQFGKPETLLVPTVAAGCSVASTDLEMPGAQGGDAHAELHATILYLCKSPAALKGISVRLFSVFPRLTRINVQLAAPGRQSATDLTRQKPNLNW